MLRIEEVERPVPKDDEVLVRVHASTVTRSDCGFRGADPFFSRVFTGLRRPKRRIPGRELAGVVEEVGVAVTEFQVGDDVFGAERGLDAEYVCVRRAATGAQTGWHHLRGGCGGLRRSKHGSGMPQEGGPPKGRSIVVYGASGSIGTATVQLAKYFGADVTAVCDTRNVRLVGRLGPTGSSTTLQEDFTRNGETYDVICDAVGKHRSGRGRRSLKPGGVYIETDLGFMWQSRSLALFSRWIGDNGSRLPYRSTRRTKSTS